MSKSAIHKTTIILGNQNLTKKVQQASEACVVLIYAPGADVGHKVELTQDQYLVGREGKVDLVLPRESVSRIHAEIRRAPDSTWFVKDRGSTNGTFVNEIRVDEKRLSDGDQIRFGDAIFKFLFSSNIESAYHGEIYRMTIMDSLTGVHNKRYFLDFLQRELFVAHRHRLPIALVMFDIDHFKRINDVKGHLCGDYVLQALCARLKKRMRREDLLARYGGEEFVAVLSVTGMEGGIRFAESICGLVAGEPFTFDGQNFSVTISLGVASIIEEPKVDATELIRRADANLYQAKHGGRNRVVPALG